MIETSNRLSLGILAAVALALPACNLDAAGQIPCVEDVSCPNDYPVCGPGGKCIAGSSDAGASVAIVGADGHAQADFLSGTVRVLVSARAASGVKTVALSSGPVNFTASATAASAPLYAFDVNTTALSDGDAPLTATLTAGDGSTGTANGTLHVDNAKPAISAFTVAGGASGAVTSGKNVPIAISATFSSGTGTLISSAGGSVGVTSGASVLVNPDAASTFKLRVTSRSGVIVESGSAGQPPDVTVNVVAPATITGGTASVSPSAIQQGTGSGNFTFTAPSFGPSVVAADVRNAAGAVVATINASGGTATAPIPDTTVGTTQLTYALVLRNGATTADTVSFPLVVSVGSPPVIAAFTGATTITSGSSASLQATFAGGDGVITPGNIPILSGGTAIVAPTTTTTYKLTVTNATTSASVSSGAAPPDVTVTVVAAPAVNSFLASGGHVTSTDPLTFSIATAGVSGNATVTGSCAPAATVPGFTIVLNGGGSGTSPAQVAPVVSASSVCTYTATVQNAASTSVVARAVVTVEPPPTIASFQFASTGTQTASFALHSDVVLSHTYDAHGGTATINGVAAGLTTTTFPNLRIDTDYVLTVTNLAGSVTSATATASVAPGSWSALNTNTFTVRKGATVTALDNGKVLIAGGLDLADTPLGTAHVCDATGACIATANNMVARAFHTATKIPQTAANNGGKVLLAGGFTTNGPPLTSTATADFYDPATNSFTSTSTIVTATVTSPRARHVAVLLDTAGTILIAGGTSDDGTTILKTAIKYNAGAAPPTKANVSNDMALARMSFTGTLLAPGGSVLIVGGRTGSTTADRTAELFDPTGTGTFSNTGALPAGEDKRSHTAVLIAGASTNVGKVLISGGVTGAGGTPSATQFLFVVGSGSFVAISSLATARSNHAAISLPTDSVLICGGTSNGTNTLATCERYDPASGLGTMFPTAAMLEARKDFGLAPITLSSFVEILAAGSPSSPMNYAETYNAN